MDPKVSVVLPVYKPGPEFRGVLEALQRQTYRALEFIVIDDASPEAVAPLVEAVSNGDPRWKAALHPKNLGLAATLNDGVRRATGDFVMIVMADVELVSPRALEEAMVFLRANPKLCLTGPMQLAFGELKPAELAAIAIRDHLPELPADGLEGRGFFELKCDIFPRAALEKAGGFDERFRVAGEDHILSFTLRREGYELAACSALTYVLRFGPDTTVRSNLSKDFRYGRSQAWVLLRTAFGSLRSTATAGQGRGRMANRLLAALAVADLGVFVLLALLLGANPLLLLLLLPFAARLAVVGRRIVLLRAKVVRPGAALAWGLALAPVDDVAYVLGLASGLAKYPFASKV